MQRYNPSNMNVLIKNALVADTSSEFNQQKVDIKIENGIIFEIGSNLSDTSVQTLTFDDLHVSSGWIDSSVSFGEPGFEERETVANGLNTAARSGFTHVVVNPNTFPVMDNQSIISFVKNKSSNAATTLYPMGAFTKMQEGVDLAELYDMKNAGAVAFGDYKKSIENANLLKIGLQYAQDFDGLIIAFANDSTIKGKGVVNEGEISTRLGLKGIPALAEDLIVARNLFLLEYTGGRMHIPTVSSAKSIALIKEAKAKGLQVTCSVAVHQLLLNDEQLQGFDTRYKVNPPLRDEKTRQALIEAVLDNTIDCITSDHQPLDIEHKKMEFDLAKDGTIGLESAFGALLQLLPLEVVIKKLTAAHFLFSDKSPVIKVGEKACLSFFTPNGTYTFSKEHILSKSKNSAFLNQTLKGKVYGIYNNAKLVIHE